MTRNLLKRLISAFTLAGAVAVLALTPKPSEAQNACALHGEIMSHLEQKYNESVSAAGLDARGNLIEVYSSDKGTWTIVFTTPGGPTCVMTSGESWMKINQTAQVEEETS